MMVNWKLWPMSGLMLMHLCKMMMNIHIHVPQKMKIPRFHRLSGIKGRQSYIMVGVVRNDLFPGHPSLDLHIINTNCQTLHCMQEAHCISHFYQ